MMYSRFHELLIILDRALFDFGSHVMVLHLPLGEWMFGAPMPERALAGWVVGGARPRAATMVTSDGSSALTVTIIVAIFALLAIILLVSRVVRRVRVGRPDRRIRNNWVKGTAQIVSVKALRAQANAPGQYQLDVVLSGEGIPATAVRNTRWVKRGIRPSASMPPVPVFIDPVDPKNFAFVWDELPAPVDTGEQRARDLEARLRAEQFEPTSTSERFAVPQGMLAAAAAGPQTPSESSRSETAPSAPLIESSNWSPTGAGKRIVYDALATMQPADALKALTALHDRGLLTDAEFADQKSRLAL